MHIFFENPFWHPDKLPKKYFRTPTHYLCFLRHPKDTIKLGEKQAKQILDRLSAQPWTDFQLKKRQILDRFSALQHNAIYIYIYVALDRFANPKNHNFPSFIVKNGPEKMDCCP